MAPIRQARRGRYLSYGSKNLDRLLAITVEPREALFCPCNISLEFNMKAEGEQTPEEQSKPQSKKVSLQTPSHIVTIYW